MRWLRFFPIAFNRVEKTTAEQIRALMADVPVRYQQTQPPNRWKLRVVKGRKRGAA